MSESGQNVKKKNTDECLVCSKPPYQSKKISSKLLDFSIKDLLLKYGGISKDKGVICRNCERRLETLHKKTVEFYDECQSAARKDDFTTPVVCNKRLPTSPLVGFHPKRASLEINEDFQQPSQHASSENMFVDLSSNAEPSNKGIPDHSYAGETITPILTQPENNVRTCIDSDHDYIYMNRNTLYNPVLPDITTFLKTTTPSRSNNHLNQEEKSILINVIQNDNNIYGALMKMDNFRNGVISELCSEIDSSISTMGNRKLLFVSELMKKDVSSLKSLEWSKIIKEMMEKLPVLCTLLFSTMLPPQQRSCYTKIEKVIPKAAFVYAILMQSRNIELSRVQRMVSMLLMDNICDQKVYDRLQPLGACLCYGRTLTVVDLIGGSFNHHLIDNLKLKRFRIIGDNVNWKTSVHDERIDNKSHMEHAFASAVIVQNTDFSYLHMPSPFHCTMQVNEFRDYIPNPNDIQNIKYDYTILIARVLQNHIPFFRQFKDVIPNEISSPISDKLKQKSRVIPLAVLHKNEQRYQDVVGILDYYEKVVEDVFSSVGKHMDDVKIHIGGDLLTRERFSGAKNLRAHHVDPKEKFSHLSPITFELFHLLMNFLTMTFKMLYSKESGAELGTLKSFQDRISRSNVGEDVKNKYDADKDFFISVVDMHIVECILHYFGMESVSSVPTVHVPPAFNNLEEKRQWLFETIGDVISKYVLSDGNTNECWTEEAIKVNGQPVVVQLTDGRKVTLMKKSKAPKYDYVKNYAQMMLELGLLFKDLMDMIKLPERTRGIRLLKVAMLYFKSHKNLSKYALDILRFLVHQLILLSEKEANEEFYGLFVNTNGHFNGHIPADLAMEHLVKKVKDHLKHMFSNKTESNIMNRTKALGAIRDIAENFEKQSKVIIRAKKHSDKSAADDEKIILKDLRKLKPFQFEAGRAHEHFSKIPSTIVNQLNTSHYFEWIEPRIQMFATEIGN